MYQCRPITVDVGRGGERGDRRWVAFHVGHFRWPVQHVLGRTELIRKGRLEDQCGKVLFSSLFGSFFFPVYLASDLLLSITQIILENLKH